MPSLKEIKTRIASVNSTRKITSAMKMVASSKLHKAQQMIENMLPYEDLLEHILKSFLVSTPDTGTPFETERKTNHLSFLVGHFKLDLGRLATTEDVELSTLNLQAI